jgi:hypothetical protein
MSAACEKDAFSKRARCRRQGVKLLYGFKNDFQIIAFCDVIPCTLIERYNILKEPAASSTLKKEVPGSSKPLVPFYETTWCHVKKTAIFTFIATGISNVTNIFSLGSKNTNILKN